MHQGLRSEVERVSCDVIRFTQDLIRIPSPSLHESEIARTVEDRMRELRYDLVFTDDVGNIVGVIVGQNPGLTILMNSHMDTVKPEPLENWRRSPFSGDIVRGRIVGVGAADCKGGLASQIYAGYALSASRLSSIGNIVVAATVAEENGCSVGVRHLLATTLPEIGMEPKFVVLGEPTELTICSGHDGWVGIDVDIFSLVEGATLSAGENVFQMLSFHCDAEEPPGGRSIMVAEQHRAVSSNNGFLSTVRVCRRLFSGESAEDVLGWLEGTVLKDLRENHAVALEVRVHAEEQQLYTGHTRRIELCVPPWSTNLMHPLVDRARESMLKAGCRWTPKTWALDRLGLGTAGGLVTSEFGIPTLGYGPGEEQQAHVCNESVSIPALVEAVYGTAVLMNGLSKTPLLGSAESVVPARSMNGRSPQTTGVE